MVIHKDYAIVTITGGGKESSYARALVVESSGASGDVDAAFDVFESGYLCRSLSSYV